MSTEPKEIADRRMYRQESLSLTRRLETAHLILPLPSRLVGDFGPVVRVPLGDVHDRCHRGTAGGRVASELVSHQRTWNSALPFLQLTEEALGCLSISPLLNEDVQGIAILVDSSPQILASALNRDENLIEEPRVAKCSLSSPHRSRVRRTEFPAPLPDGLIGDDYPTLSEQILDITKAQSESVIEPNGLADDLRRVAVAPIRDLVSDHVPSLTAARST